MASTTQDDGDVKQDSDLTAKVCEVCEKTIESDEYMEYRKPTGGRRYRHEECHNEEVRE